MPELMNTPRLKAMRDRVLRAQDEQQRQETLSSLAREISNQLSETTIKGVDQAITVGNLDEVRASLRNELRAVIKGLKELNLTAEEQNRILEESEDRVSRAFKNDFETVIIKHPRDLVEVTNLKDIVLPELPTDVSITNLSDIEQYFKDLATALEGSLNVEVPAPKVTVQPTPVNIPRQDINIPPVNLRPVADAIREGMRKLNENSVDDPLAVRLSDGDEFIDALDQLVKKQEIAFQGFSDTTRLKNSKGLTVDPATEASVAPPASIGTGNKDVSSAGTAEKLTATVTPCKEVIITAKVANTNKIYYGGSSVDSSNGAYIFAGQTARIPINDVSKVYIDADTNSEGVQYTYVA